MAEAIFAKGLAYRDFTPAHAGTTTPLADRGLGVSASRAPGCFNPGMRDLSRAESDRRAAAGEPFALRFRVPRGHKPHAALHRCGLRRAVEAGRRGRGLRPAAQRRHADLSSGLVRRRRRPAHQPHHSRPGSPLQHLQAPADLRGDRQAAGAAVRRSSRTFRCWLRPTAPSSPSAATGRWSASPPIATRVFCPRRSSIFSACSAGRQRTTASFLTLPELVAAFSLAGVNRANAVVNFTRGGSLRSQSRLAQRRAHPRLAGRAAGRAAAARGAR